MTADTDGIVVRDLAGLAERTAASALYRSVFGYQGPEHAVSPRLLAALHENAGTVLGAFDEAGCLIGFCYGFTAVEHGELYHYSQATVVDARAQGRGVGRQLKHAQADAARRTGAGTMRWTFDPYALRNAHFNLAVLGAAGIRFLPDFYDDGGSDRVLVRWDLDRPGSGTRAPASGHPAEGPSGHPAVDAPADDRTAAGDPDDRARLRRELADRFAAGGRLVGVARREDTPGRVSYLFGQDQA
ncbi:GNAT family N-acetyltransferase [Micromonospora peucetia]|uniref:GNAT family N-acetyltransferase n=1 Tax=Micromonospora peucetia TaxID=47871 RepID=A0A1C6VWB5_9ACTN|nr:GNAT family N-acetyltransferase [Micromonospora peucetia]MCX4387911.1 GNAT family N-acetyltransferase [Micromonospora peucetia]WSA31382.1 GNAT family N-acetyltransferase [Micromonospora peucetia]SCL70651.1 Predicted acetyltransferase, GNAT superfamily [Micromonospora peucetia]